MKVFLLIITAALFSPSAYSGTSADLDSAYLKAIGTASTRESTDALSEIRKMFFDKTRGTWDGSGGFPAIAIQSPLGACQSFEMTAFLEYIYFFNTGKVLDLSEKFTAYNLLKWMIKNYWNEEKKTYDQVPTLGSGTDGVMIDALMNSGIMPSASYPWGDLKDNNEAAKSIDVQLFKQVFENPDAKYTPEEYTDLLNKAFLSPPPERFYLAINQFNFKKPGETETTIVRTPLELLKFLGITKERFKIVYNSDLDSIIYSIPKDKVSQLMQSMAGQTTSLQVPNEITTSEKLLAQVMDSLDRRMVVGLAADVWMGDWQSESVDPKGGGHGMVIVGYQTRSDDVYFKIRNSWGTKIGVEGYNFISSKTLAPNIYWVKIYN